MTRNHNQRAWEAIEQLVCHYQDDERRDYESLDATDRDGHIYEVWVQLDRWADIEREAARRGYNGWANYETWLSVFWHGSEEQNYRFWSEATRECVRVAGYDPKVLSGEVSVHASARASLAARLSKTIPQELGIGIAGFAAESIGLSWLATCSGITLMDIAKTQSYQLHLMNQAFRSLTAHTSLNPAELLLHLVRLTRYRDLK